jgi:hypothetical protein
MSQAAEKICTFLSRGDLLTLRQVCRSTKSWAESPPILSTICVDIKRPNHLERLLKPKRTINFSNIKIQLEKLASQTMLSVDLFIKEYGPGLRVLKITSPSGYLRKLDILLGCPSLEVVHISDLTFRNIPPQDISSFGNCFRNYKDFGLDYLLATTRTDVGHLLEWISSSTKLEHLRLPQLQFDDNNGGEQEEAKEGKDFFLNKIILPLIEVIKRRRIGSSFSTIQSEAVKRSLLHVGSSPSQ